LVAKRNPDERALAARAASEKLRAALGVYLMCASALPPISNPSWLDLVRRVLK
jgi:hypothetical protein